MIFPYRMKIMRARKLLLFVSLSTAASVFIMNAPAAFAQVSAAEILNPDLKALEQQYLPQLKAINQAIGKTQFPFPFYLSRYVGLDPAQQVETDSRGLEFVRFQDRIVLKVTGNYNAAYDTQKMTQNERAARTFHDVIAPILRLVTADIPPDINCDSIGFEISHHARTRDKNFDYEGKEIIVLVLDRDDAFLLSQTASDPDRQEILNRSKIYLNGKEFGLSLSERDPLNVQALPRSVPTKIDASSTAGASTSMNRLARLSPMVMPTPAHPESPVFANPPAAASDSVADAGSHAAPAVAALPAPTQADAEHLGDKYHAQLDGLAKLGMAKFNFVDYSPPTFVVFGNRMALQMTLRNTLHFDPAKSSIYRRAAQSFDLFLAPKFKDLLEKIPAEMEFQFFDFSVINQLGPGPKAASEAVEFICPRAALRQFADAEITNQQLIDQSVVLVNGVRVALNLQLVE
jgi:hypothetical protein